MRGLYVHVPFCLKKCDYCDFVSYTDCFSREEEYVSALLSEFGQYRGTKVDTVYVGGGTPTSLQTKSLVRILDGAFAAFDVAEDAEITVECNPKTADLEKFTALKHAGVNRLSIGVQSLDDTILKTIGRIHSAQDATDCVKMAYSAGFSNISGDLMFGLPGQSMESLERSIDGMLKLPFTHISCYGLILEDATPLAEKVRAGAYTLPDEDTEYAMYCNINETLKANGFSRYEISNFAKDGFFSRHNVKYWDCIEYIGCGAGAHSYFEGIRYCHTEDVSAYIQNPAERQDVIHIDSEDAMREFMMLGLRKTEGVSKTEFQNRFGKTISDCFGEIIKTYKEKGLLSETEDRIFFTEQGIYVSNMVLCEFA